MAYAPGIFTGEIIDAAVNEIPTAFSAAAGSRISGLRAYAHVTFSHLQIINTTAAMISFVTGVSDEGVPSSNGKRARCPANYTVTFEASPGQALVLDNLFFQSESGSAIEEGTVLVNLW